MVNLRTKDDRYEIYDLEMEGLVLSVTCLNPNKCTRGHKHDYEEAYYFAQGCGRVELDRRIVNVKSGDLLRIPPNTFHRVFNDSDFHQLTFVCAFTGKSKKELLHAMWERKRQGKAHPEPICPLGWG
jgi:mannose-6-phosphate isomerase-like protein (cupin superfamily)